MAVSKTHSHISNPLINQRKLEPPGIIDSSNKLILQEFLEMCWLEQVGSTDNKDKVFNEERQFCHGKRKKLGSKPGLLDTGAFL